MEEVAEQHNDFITDSNYLMDSVCENMQQQARRGGTNTRDQWTEQSEELEQVNISNNFSCANQQAGFEGPGTNPQLLDTLIVDSGNP
jgi:hypothetical protein